MDMVLKYCLCKYLSQSDFDMIIVLMIVIIQIAHEVEEAARLAEARASLEKQLQRQLDRIGTVKRCQKQY